ncbi:Alpha amylase, catalytic domain [Lachnospiraceae bacterium RM5]|nr:Alpha amylase, catalytic domain [Lachnospiraceae bacterium RM5]
MKNLISKKTGIFKKSILFLLIASMIFSLSACRKKNPVFKEDEAVTGERLQADWIDKAIIYEVNVRQYTKEGTFDAFSKHLERLKNMGINTLWFMPIYPISEENRKGELGSYYSISDYKNINPEFGNLDDFKNLVDKAHEMGFHVIIDWVANHTGWDHVWIKEHPDYYVHDDEGNIIHPLNTDWYDVAQLDYDNEDMQTAMIDAMSFWVKDMDVDGFRCDYAQGVPVAFWEKARTELDKIKPIYMLAEDGTESSSLLLNAFDSDYNFNLYSSLTFASKMPGSADSILKHFTEDLPFGSFRMSFLDNHDQNTYSGSLNLRYDPASLNALYAVIFTGYGVPLIYSGNEEDIDISLEFFDKDDIEFGDYKYEEILTDLANIKTSYKPLYNGIYGGKVREIKEDNKSVIAYERVKDGEKITLIANISNTKQTVKYSGTISYGDVLLHGKGEEIVSDKKEELNIKDLNELEPFEFYIIYSQSGK